MPSRLLSSSCLAAVMFFGPGTAAAAPVWVADMETGDLSQWGYLLNNDVNGQKYSTVTMDPVVEGQWAARIELHNDAVWPNGLKRVELQHGPDPARTAEGATLFFGWSFYLPEALPQDPSQQIGYWESGNSYQQMMAFEISGERITFSTRKPMNVVQWDQDGAATPGVWHRIAMRIAWSKDPQVGTVDVWFDGEQVVTAAPAQTLADDNPHFTQLGLLRGKVEFADVPVIVIDDAVEGDNLEDVHPEPTPPGGTSSGGETGDTAGSSGGEQTTTGSTSGEAPTTGGGSSGEAPTTGGATGSASTTTAAGSSGGGSTGEASASDGSTTLMINPVNEGGCGCDAGAGGSVASLGLLLLARRRRRARR